MSGGDTPAAMPSAGIDEVDLHGAAVLLVAGEANQAILRGILEADGFTNLLVSDDPWTIVDMVRANDVALLFIDLELNEMNGFQVVQLVGKETAGRVPGMILVGGPDDTDVIRRALVAGADCVRRPLIDPEVVMRAHHLLRATLTARRPVEPATAPGPVSTEGASLGEAQQAILDRLALAAEFRDDDTGEHTRRVGQTAGILARELGLSEQVAEMISRAAPLHDVGKIGIRDKILLKPGKLTDDEMEEMKTHTLIGEHIVTSEDPLLWLAGQICLTHHERWDGSGYPRGLAGEDIPLPGRIVSVADVFDTLMSVRAYKRAWPRHEALAEILNQSGKMFDPRVVDAFLKIQPQLTALEAEAEQAAAASG